MNYPTFNDRYGQKAAGVSPQAGAVPSMPEETLQAANPWESVPTQPQADEFGSPLAPMQGAQQPQQPGALMQAPNPWVYEGK